MHAALARSSDPVTSHLAASRVAEFARKHHDAILATLARCGPLTAHEIAHHCGIEAHAVGKRMAELERAGAAQVVRKCGLPVTRPTPSGRSARVWEAV